MANTYDLTQTGSEVQAILNDANNIKGAGAQTTLTTDYVLLKDTNGQYHKILKDSFTEACRNVLAGLLVNNDKGTTISQIAAIASGDFGSVTPANLASVLGVKQSSYLTQGESASFVRGTVVCLSKTTKNLLAIVKTGTTESYTVIMNFGTNTTDVSVSWNNDETVITNNGSGNLSYIKLI